MGKDRHLIRNVDHLHTCHHLQSCLHSSILLQTDRQYLEDQALFPPSSKYLMRMKCGSKEEDSSQSFLLRLNVLVNGVKRKSEEWKNRGRQHVLRS
ncbi:proline rich coiled-coil 2C [Rhinolophus ferrumequinum]|uniref:Proline rich coiled-coil 2C n=1 Tax=Rhinolophus ferrumequinum TaxID=59479 RepID=A0A7J7SZL3_RHIFE|nr:proline rich coiled-coil 2C [Rhinolophus ferrumequinum]